MHSYYSTEIDFIQRIGRLRQDEDKEGNVITSYINSCEILNEKGAEIANNIFN